MNLQRTSPTLLSRRENLAQSTYKMTLGSSEKDDCQCYSSTCLNNMMMTARCAETDANSVAADVAGHLNVPHRPFH